MSSNNRRVSQVYEPGNKGRKTGLFISKTLKKNDDGLEDPNDYYLSDEEYETPASHRKTITKAKSTTPEHTKSFPNGVSKDQQMKAKVLQQLRDDIERDSFVSDLDSDVSDDVDEKIRSATDIGSPIKVSFKSSGTTLSGSPSQPHQPKFSSVEQTSHNSKQKQKPKSISIGLSKTPPSLKSSTQQKERKRQSLENGKSSLASISSKPHKELGMAEIASNPTGYFPSERRSGLKIRKKKIPKIGIDPGTFYPSEARQRDSLVSESRNVMLGVNSKQGQKTIAKEKPAAEKHTINKLTTKMHSVKEPAAQKQLTEVKLAEKHSTPKKVIGKEPVQQSVAESSVQVQSVAKLSDDKLSTETVPNNASAEKESSEKSLTKEQTLQKQQHPQMESEEVQRSKAQPLDEQSAGPKLVQKEPVETQPDAKTSKTDDDIIIFENIPVHSPVPKVDSPLSKDTSFSKSKASAFTKNIALNKKKTKSKPIVSRVVMPAVTTSASPEESPFSDEHELSGFSRRSTRHKIKPIAYWKNEKVIYEMKHEGETVVPELKEIIEVTEDEEPESRHSRRLTMSKKLATSRRKSVAPKSTRRQSTKSPSPLGNDESDDDVRPLKKRRRVSTAPLLDSPSQKVDGLNSDKPVVKEEFVELIEQYVEGQEDSESERNQRQQRPVTHKSQEKYEPQNEEEEEEYKWTKSGKLAIPVFEGPGSESQLERTVAFAPNSEVFSQTVKNAQDNFIIRTLFDQDCDFCGGGVIEIPGLRSKSLKSNDDTYFIFYVIEGFLEVTISSTHFIVTPGCSFEVPMGNFYSVENKRDTTAKLFFIQSKYVPIEAYEDSEFYGNENDTNDKK